MELLLLLVFLLALGLAAARGWTADSRDSRDWTDGSADPYQRRIRTS